MNSRFSPFFKKHAIIYFLSYFLVSVVITTRFSSLMKFQSIAFHKEINKEIWHPRILCYPPFSSLPCEPFLHRVFPSQVAIHFPLFHITFNIAFQRSHPSPCTLTPHLNPSSPQHRTLPLLPTTLVILSPSLLLSSPPSSSVLLLPLKEDEARLDWH